MHLVLGCISSVLIWLVFWIHLRVRRHPEESLPKYRLPIEAVAVLLVGLTGHLGGFLSGVNGQLDAQSRAEKFFHCLHTRAEINQRQRRKLMKLLCGVMALACVPVALAGNNVPYPKENVAEFVVERLDVTTLPSTIRPKPEKRKKTFGDYDYVTRQLDEKEALVETTPGGSQIDIRILEQETSGIYVCIEGPGKNASSGQIQRVFLLKLKNANGLLKGRESSKEFDGCPVIGIEPAPVADWYGG